MQGVFQVTTLEDGAIAALLCVAQWIFPVLESVQGFPENVHNCNPVLSRYYWTFWAHVGCCSLFAEAHGWPGWVDWHIGQDLGSLVVPDEALTPTVSPLVSYLSFNVCHSSTF